MLVVLVMLVLVVMMMVVVVAVVVVVVISGFQSVIYILFLPVHEFATLVLTTDVIMSVLTLLNLEAVDPSFRRQEVA